jgi:hypothetical protein
MVRTKGPIIRRKVANARTGFIQKHAKVIIAVQAALIAALVTVFGLPKFPALIDLIDPANLGRGIISSHFYELGLVDLAPSLNLPWVSGTSDGKVLAMSADSGFEEDSNPRLGAFDPLHEIYLIDPNTPAHRKIAEVNFLDIVFGEGKWPEDTKHRSLDFISSPLQSESQREVFISFTSSSEQIGCRHLHVIRLQFSTLHSLGGKVIADEFFRSECFPKSTLDDFRLHQSGGRIAIDAKKISEGDTVSEILLSIGDFVMLRENSTSLTQNARAQLTSVIRIDDSGWEVVADGFRNPQGLAFANLDGLGQVLLESEHGPRGGDELNLVRTGKKYYWPDYSYGTAYEPEDPNNKPVTEGASISADPPWYAWVPSIAPSQVLQVSGQEFSKWWTLDSKQGAIGDVLVSTLGDQSIIRLRVEAGHVRYSERIGIGERIRSLSALPSGEILLGTDSGKALKLGAVSEWLSSEGSFKKVGP